MDLDWEYLQYDEASDGGRERGEAAAPSDPAAQNIGRLAKLRAALGVLEAIALHEATGLAERDAFDNLRLQIDALQVSLEEARVQGSRQQKKRHTPRRHGNRKKKY